MQLLQSQGVPRDEGRARSDRNNDGGTPVQEDVFDYRLVGTGGGGPVVSVGFDAEDN